MKRVTRKGRHVRFGQIPFKAAFSGRRAQSPAVIVAGQFTPSWLLYGAPFMPPRKRAQGFDVALYRRGAGRLVGAEVDFAASRTSSWHAPTAEKTSMLPLVSQTSNGKSHHHEPPLCKGRWLPVGQTEGLYATSPAKHNPSAPSGQLPLHKGAFLVGCYQGCHPPQGFFPQRGRKLARSA